jgi:hypothetical protein
MNYHGPDRGYEETIAYINNNTVNSKRKREMQNLRFDKHSDSHLGRGQKFTVTKGDKTYTKFMPGTGSKDREEFLKFRKNWSVAYNEVVSLIREAKQYIQENKTEHALTANARRQIEVGRAMARSMMMGLQAIKIQKDFDNKRNTSLLEPRIPVAMRVREKYVPSDEEIEKNRQAKRERLAQAD